MCSHLGWPTLEVRPAIVSYINYILAKFLFPRLQNSDGKVAYWLLLSSRGSNRQFSTAYVSKSPLLFYFSLKIVRSALTSSHSMRKISPLLVQCALFHTRLDFNREERGLISRTAAGNTAYRPFRKVTIILFACPPKFYISIVFVFSRDHCKSQEKLEPMLTQNLKGQTKSIMVFFEVAYCSYPSPCFVRSLCTY